MADHVKNCETCGAAFTCHSTRARFCPECRKKRDSARAKAYADKKKAEDPAAYAQKRKATQRRYYLANAEKCNEANRKARARWKIENPERIEKIRASQKAWYEANREYVLEYHKKRREQNRLSCKKYYEKNSDAIKEAKKLERKIANAKKEGNFSVLLELGQLPVCERMRLVALHLPCGQREECFGGIAGKDKCPKCPANARPPARNNEWGRYG